MATMRKDIIQVHVVSWMFGRDHGEGCVGTVEGPHLQFIASKVQVRQLREDSQAILQVLCAFLCDTTLCKGQMTNIQRRCECSGNMRDSLVFELGRVQCQVAQVPKMRQRGTQRCSPVFANGIGRNVQMQEGCQCG